MYHNVLNVFHDVLLCLIMFYDVLRVVQQSAVANRLRDRHNAAGPSGIFLPGTELLQSPFNMGSRLRRSLQCHRRFLPSYCQSLRACGIVAIPEAIGGRAVADAATPIVA